MAHGFCEICQESSTKVRSVDMAKESTDISQLITEAKKGNLLAPGMTVDFEVSCNFDNGLRGKHRGLLLRLGRRTPKNQGEDALTMNQLLPHNTLILVPRYGEALGLRGPGLAKAEFPVAHTRHGDLTPSWSPSPPRAGRAG